MKFLVLSLVFLLTTGLLPATAQSIEVPQQRPLLNIDIPSRWTYERTGSGVQILAPNQDVYLVLQVANSADGFDAVLEGMIRILENRGYTDVREGGRSTEVLNGVEMQSIAYTARLQGRREEIVITAGIVNRRAFVSMLVGTRAGLERNARALAALRSSTIFYTR